MKKGEVVGRKVLDFCLDFLETPMFQKKILEVRKKWKIPEKGFTMTEKDKQNMENKIFDFPEQFVIELQPWTSPFNSSFQGKFGRKYLKDKMLPLNLSKSVISNEINSDLFFSEIKKHLWVKTTILLHIYLFFDVITFSDNKKIEEKIINIVELNELDKKLGYTLFQIKENTPVAICIGPEISKRDLISYINKYWGEIENINKTRYGKSGHLDQIKNLNDTTRTRNRIIARFFNSKNGEIKRELAKTNIFLTESEIATYKKLLSQKEKRIKEV